MQNVLEILLTSKLQKGFYTLSMISEKSKGSIVLKF
ncbi:MAG: hypothetical protein ACI8VT_002426 [Saprospiraceae bacterium]|jgi:hypothetical protein